MKKIFASLLALTALAAVSCRQEATAPETPAQGRPICIRATVDEMTKTAYADEKTFSWEAGDAIALLVYKEEDNTTDVITLYTEDAGPYADFYGTLPEGYREGDLAFYPKKTSGGDYTGNAYNTDLRVNKGTTDVQVQLRGTITLDPENPLSCVPMVGVRKASGAFQFSAAMGILKLTAVNVPMDAGYFALDAPAGTALNGVFTLDAEDNSIRMANAVSGWEQKYLAIHPQAQYETRTYYWPVPVGTLPAGATFSLINKAYTAYLFQKATKKDIEVKRGVVTDLGTVKVYDYPVSATVTGMKVSARSLSLQVAAGSDVATLKAGIAADADAALAAATASTETISTGEVTLTVPAAITDGMDAVVALVACDAEGTVRASTTLPFTFSSLISLTADMVSASYEATYNNGALYEGGGAAALVDGDYTTYWHSPWYFAEGFVCTDNPDPTYGIYIDIALQDPIQTFALKYWVRHNNNNARPRMLVFGVSNDGESWTVAGTAETEAMAAAKQGESVMLDKIQAEAPFRYLRIGIATAGDGPSDLRVARGGSAAIAEILLYGE